MEPAQVVILLLIGYIIFTIDKRTQVFPRPPVLAGVGMILYFIPFFEGIELSEVTLYEVILPALLFISAYKFSVGALKANSWSIVLLSTAGLMLTVLGLGGVIYLTASLFVTLSFTEALLIAAILTPTDPVSVTSILHKSLDNEMVGDVVEGESLINDGTSYVIFATLLSIHQGSESFSFLSFMGEFLYVAIGGAFIGIVFGWLVSRAVHFTHHQEYQVMLSIVMAYGLFLLAEAFGISGVLATVAAGLMLSWEFNRINKEDHYRESLDHFWDVVEPTLLSLVFLLIGYTAVEHLKWEWFGFAAVVFVLSLIIRTVIVLLTSQSVPPIRKSISWKESLLISFGGVKGTMSVVLLLILEASDTGGTEAVMTVAFIAVLLSLFIQSIGVHPLAKLLKS
ncbi:sodium:proton antiporter [Jeotgalibacillus alimentarius]|uniref:Sodium:proton antiporter n=1 Tax=Jeotgalibacillus alimentarius TaxID=135826 RepID=A0A0C2W7V1_9BACL|nr:sodium:proton antiporter [Jeotgalibacillus alimentarius]KIL52656.1 sodium:proton antiporter [Jeotgalibacillus alimentarius]